MTFLTVATSTCTGNRSTRLGPPHASCCRVARAGRFGTKGLAISFVSSDTDEGWLQKVQERFEVKIPEMPQYMDNITLVRPFLRASAPVIFLHNLAVIVPVERLQQTL
jgi:hypothetical protein